MHHMCLVERAQGQLFQGIEGGRLSRCLSRTDSGDARNTLLCGYLIDPNGKDELLAPSVNTGRSYVNTARVSTWSM